MKVTLIRSKSDQTRIELDFGDEVRVLFLYPSGVMALAAAILDKAQNPDSPQETVLNISINPTWMKER